MISVYRNPANDALSISVHDDIYKQNRQKQAFFCTGRPRRFGQSIAAAML